MTKNAWRKVFVPMTLLISLVVVGCEKDPQGQNNNGNEDDSIVGIGVFSVSDTSQVTFAPGNLAEGGRSFVDNQYQLGGYFGWGSGNHPSDTSTDYRDYLEFHDWGDYIEGGWRTLTYDEWHYIIYEREFSREKVAAGTVISVKDTMTGLILLPDNWTFPDSCQFWPGMYGYERNQYSLEHWHQMEKAGAVFLRAGGYRWGSTIYYIDRWELTHGNYWLSTQYDEDDAHYIYFIANLDNILPTPITNLAAGMQVRLVRNVN